jgi:hypothetical protein
MPHEIMHTFLCIAFNNLTPCHSVKNIQCLLLRNTTTTTTTSLATAVPVTSRLYPCSKRALTGIVSTLSLS